MTWWWSSIHRPAASCQKASVLSPARMAPAHSRAHTTTTTSHPGWGASHARRRRDTAARPPAALSSLVSPPPLATGSDLIPTRSGQTIRKNRFGRGSVLADSYPMELLHGEASLAAPAAARPAAPAAAPRSEEATGAVDGAVSERLPIALRWAGVVLAVVAGLQSGQPRSLTLGALVLLLCTLAVSVALTGRASWPRPRLALAGAIEAAVGTAVVSFTGNLHSPFLFSLGATLLAVGLEGGIPDAASGTAVAAAG